jgi:STAM-binding protein
MTLSLGTDTFTRISQFRIATFQCQTAPRPHSIAELAEMAKDSLGDEDFPFKTWLRIAENARRSAKSYREQDDLESEFVEYAKAAIISLEKIPGHPDYTIRLNSTQRHNISLVS